MISINVILTTIGRTTLGRMLDSLLPQLQEQDYLTVVSDANHNYSRCCICEREFKCTVTHIANPQALGYWGHGSRNKYQNILPGDYIMNADDDDRYVPGAFDRIREVIADQKLYLFKHEHNGRFAWSVTDYVGINNVGTSCGVIPNVRTLPDWGYFYGGDGEFFSKVAAMMPYEFVDHVIYKVGNTK